jgi:hypothetical protein
MVGLHPPKREIRPRNVTIKAIHETDAKRESLGNLCDPAQPQQTGRVQAANSLVQPNVGGTAPFPDENRKKLLAIRNPPSARCSHGIGNAKGGPVGTENKEKDVIQLTFKAANQTRDSKGAVKSAARFAVLTASAFLGGLVSPAEAQQTQPPQRSSPFPKKAAAPVANADRPRKVESVDGGYTVEMPGRTLNRSEDLGRGMTQKMLIALSAKGNYAASYVDLRGSSANVKNVRAALKGFVKGSRKGVAIEKEAEISLGRRAVPGIEFECEARKGLFVRERVYIDGARLHQVWVASKDRAFLRSAEVQRFFDSFELTEARPKAEQPAKPVDWSIF